MRILLTLLGKETRALFSSSIAYVVITVFLLLMGYAFTAFLFLNTLGNFASTSTAEKLVFGSLGLVLAIACLLVSASRSDQ